MKFHTKQLSKRDKLSLPDLAIRIQIKPRYELQLNIRLIAHNKYTLQK